MTARNDTSQRLKSDNSAHYHAFPVTSVLVSSWAEFIYFSNIKKNPICSNRTFYFKYGYCSHAIQFRIAYASLLELIADPLELDADPSASPVLQKQVHVHV